MLKLTNNYITSLTEIKKLEPLHISLYQLELLGNPLCETNMYMQRVFKALPELDILDGVDRDGNEVMSDEDDVNEDMDLDDYGDEQDMIADGVMDEKKKRKGGGEDLSGRNLGRGGGMSGKFDNDDAEDDDDEDDGEDDEEKDDDEDEDLEGKEHGLSSAGSSDKSLQSDRSSSEGGQ